MWLKVVEPAGRSLRAAQRHIRKGISIRYIVIVDGEHYPPVVQAALEDLEAEGHEVAGAVLVGGTEKIPAGGLNSIGAFALRSGGDPRTLVLEAIDELAPDAVMDFSDEPVLDYRRRFELASLSLLRGVPYVGADFSLSPPPRPRVATKPTIAVIGTGKRTGKTAVAAQVARTLKGAGMAPVVVAMGRGGPPEPEVLRGDTIELTPSDLLELADAGKHAASDYVEDAFMARVPTVGCRRCGGGLAGAVGASNVERGVEVANELPGDVMILEGSGSAIPPVHADVTLLVMPASVPHEHIAGYLGVYRLLLADAVVVTMCEEPFGSTSQISSLADLVSNVGGAVAGLAAAGRSRPEGGPRLVRTVLRPNPTESVVGARVFVTTTAPEEAAGAIVEHLTEQHGCSVAGISHRLSDRGALEDELARIENDVDVLLCEIKAAAIDVVTRFATDTGRRVVFMDNVPTGVHGDDLQQAVVDVARTAVARSEGKDG